jgi:hypothetical protein
MNAVINLMIYMHREFLVQVNDHKLLKKTLYCGDD